MRLALNYPKYTSFYLISKNTPSKHAPQVERDYWYCMQNNQSKIIGNQLPKVSLIKLEANSNRLHGNQEMKTHFFTKVQIFHIQDMPRICTPLTNDGQTRHEYPHPNPFHRLKQFQERVLGDQKGGQLVAFSILLAVDHGPAKIKIRYFPN